MERSSSTGLNQILVVVPDKQISKLVKDALWKNCPDTLMGVPDY
jgi:hypothetical protein